MSFNSSRLIYPKCEEENYITGFCHLNFVGNNNKIMVITHDEREYVGCDLFIKLSMVMLRV